MASADPKLTPCVTYSFIALLRRVPYQTAVLVRTKDGANTRRCGRRRRRSEERPMIRVTGASGTVGSEVVRALGAVKSRVRAGYRTRPQNVPEGVESVALDYDRPHTLRPALEGVDTLFLVSNSITPELTVVDEARHAGVKRIVKLSVLNAAEEGYIFARWHRLIEKHIEASGLEWTSLRSNGFMQNVVTYMGETIRTQSAFYSSGGNG